MRGFANMDATTGIDEDKLSLDRDDMMEKSKILAK